MSRIAVLVLALCCSGCAVVHTPRFRPAEGGAIATVSMIPPDVGVAVYMPPSICRFDDALRHVRSADDFRHQDHVLVGWLKVMAANHADKAKIIRRTIPWARKFGGDVVVYDDGDKIVMGDYGMAAQETAHWAVFRTKSSIPPRESWPPKDAGFVGPPRQ